MCVMNERSIEEILENYYKTKDTGDLAFLFKFYMAEIGAKKLDRRRKDTSNTYQIDGYSTNWNRVKCCYYRNSGDCQEYGKFEFCIVFRKRAGDYLLIEMGNSNCDIQRPYEISCGKVIHYNKELLEELVKQHPKLFSMMRDDLTKPEAEAKLKG